jgi:hypothetical protein
VPEDPGPATRTRVTRRIAADPTSTALLLAGPTAFELWPGVRRVAEVAGRMVVETELAPHRPAAASVRALPPQRTPTSYVTRFEWSGPGLPRTVGELTLGYAPTGDGEVGTHAALVLDSADVARSTLSVAALEEMATGFLANLAHAAELRNRAA